MNISQLIFDLDNLLWATPLIALTFGLAVVYCFAMKFGNITKAKLQWDLLTKSEGSETGLSAFETFCSVAAYRVAIGNVGGVMVAIMYGGPGAVFWMIVTALVTSAIAYAENSLGQIYKVRMDGQYRGGPYFYMEKGVPVIGKAMAVIFALFCTIGVPFLVTGPSANNIAQAFEMSFGVPRWIPGLVVAALLFLVIAGGVRRIAQFSTMIVPFMTIGYLIITIIVLVTHASNIGPTIGAIMGSAFNTHAVFGGAMGGAFSYGVKRAVNSSGSGFGETPPAAAAAETAHPATQGLVNAFSVYIDVAVCACSGIMALVSGCFNVLAPDGKTFIYVSEDAVVKGLSESNTANVLWVQQAANSSIPFIGGIIIAIAITCFAYSTCIAYYYEGESGLAYLMRNSDEKARMKVIWFIRIAMPIFFFLWSLITASTAWAISEVMFALMAWFNLISLIFLLPTVKKVYDDYMSQLKAGVEDPYFDPDKVGIKDMELWKEINKDRIAAGK
ncbi:MAG: alanine:cation symporter family protein [Clostridium sp.]|nr:alanine:cation symporter family protein [Clostridium sp.]